LGILPGMGVLPGSKQYIMILVGLPIAFKLLGD